MELNNRSISHYGGLVVVEYLWEFIAGAEFMIILYIILVNKMDLYFLKKAIKMKITEPRLF
jgi:hypothetical protein